MFCDVVVSVGARVAGGSGRESTHHSQTWAFRAPLVLS